MGTMADSERPDHDEPDGADAGGAKSAGRADKADLLDDGDDEGGLAALTVRVKTDWREWARMWAPWVGLAVLVAIVSWFFVKPAPPKRVTIAAGPKDGAYYAFAQEYARTFAASGVTLEVRETAGTVENYRLLNEGAVDLAIAQGGSAPEGLTADLKSIGSLYFEPVWIFYRPRPDDTTPRLRGRRIAIGPPGSGTALLAQRILGANGVRDGTPATAPSSAPATTGPAVGGVTTFVPIGGHVAIDALKAGDVDAAFLVISPRSPMVKDLLAADGVRLMSIDRHEAYERNFPFLSGLKLPRGVLDIEHDLPPADVYLIAPAANLVCRSDLHPALVPLACKAAVAAHGRGDLLSKPGAFPTTQYVEFPQDSAAESYFKNGPPFLQKYLPFWVAAWVDRTKVLLLPLITLIVPLLRVAPPVYDWRIRSRIYRWYKVLRDVDDKLRSEDPEASRRGYDRELGLVRRLERRLAQSKVPLSYAEHLYNLRVHADFVHRKLERRVERDRRRARKGAGDSIGEAAGPTSSA